jgi:outer membrane protein assembly factor BamE (lipoprotein component of BamABCDE complex)
MVKILIPLLAFTSLMGCNTMRSSEKPKPDGKRSYEEFGSTIKEFPYEASKEKRQKIIGNFNSLEIGMSKNEVAESIGEPDYSDLDYGPKGPAMKWLGSHWTYYLYKRETGANDFDPRVTIFFGKNDRAKWIVPRNVEGLSEKGSPAHDGT